VATLLTLDPFSSDVLAVSQIRGTKKHFLCVLTVEEIKLFEYKKATHGNSFTLEPVQAISSDRTRYHRLV
jgi:hypothetical protein